MATAVPESIATEQLASAQWRLAQSAYNAADNYARARDPNIALRYLAIAATSPTHGKEIGRAQATDLETRAGAPLNLKGGARTPRYASHRRAAPNLQDEGLGELRFAAEGITTVTTWSPIRDEALKKPPPAGYPRSDLKPARTSSENSCGCSQAAKCPPLARALKWMRLW